MDNIVSLSYGKDSMACFEACKILGIPIHGAVHAEVWATDTIPADLPEMVEFKVYADEQIHKRYGIKVEHYRADVTYEDVFYRKVSDKTLSRRLEKHMHIKKFAESKNKDIYGFPCMMGAWCNGKLKVAAIRKAEKAHGGCRHVVGIASDEPKRIERAQKRGDILPLVQLGWTESGCATWCQDNLLYAPTYRYATRDGCWFCHNQSVSSLRLLRRAHPELWTLLLKWDQDSPYQFKIGRTVQDYEERFFLEDAGLIRVDEPFRWESLHKDLQYSMF